MVAKAFTSKASDWILFLQFELKDYAHAIRLERKIKSMKSRKYILNLSKYPELREKIINEAKSAELAEVWDHFITHLKPRISMCYSRLFFVELKFMLNYLR